MAKDNVISIDDAYTNIKPLMKERDGNIHVLALRNIYNLRMIDDSCPYIIKNYTSSIDAIVSKIQSDGYELIDLKPVSQGDCILVTLVMYK